MTATRICSSPGSDSDEESVVPWDQWATFVEELDPSGEHHGTSCSSASTAIFRLPIDTYDDPIAHREQIGLSLYPDNLCVARPVGKAAIDKTPAAKEAMRKEWDRLRSKYVWDEDHPREWDGVRAEA